MEVRAAAIVSCEQQGHNTTLFVGFPLFSPLLSLKPKGNLPAAGD